MYVVRGLGGVLYLTGAGIMCFNLWQTARGRLGGERAPSPAAVAAE
jgi:cytochrome c oxidase cbb3-type subunit 1